MRTLYYFLGRNEDFFLKKYQAYYRPRDSKEDIFRMSQQENENLEEYLE